VSKVAKQPSTSGAAASISLSCVVLLLYLGLLVLITTVLCELAAKRDWLPYWVSRKILHIVAVGSCAVAGYLADSLGHRELLIWIVASAEVLLLGLIGFGGLMREESGRRPWGIVWFPLAFLVLLLLSSDAETIGFSMAILAICDPAATIAGKLSQYKEKKPTERLDAQLIKENTLKTFWIAMPYQLTGDPKTVIGNLAFFSTYFLLCQLIPTCYFLLEPDPLFCGCQSFAEAITYQTLVLSGLMLTAGEALGSKGSDNLIVPILAATLLNIDMNWLSDLSVLAMILAASVFSYLTIRRRSLSPGGAVTASLLGIIVALTAGPIWLLPLFLFFGSSSLIGKLFPTTSAAADAKQKQPRDATQVLANGGVYVALALMMYYEQHSGLIRLIMTPWELLLLTAAAVATADTWSSELGQYFRQPTWDLVKWRRVPAGLSGGVSWPGTLAGMAGAMFIASWGFLLVQPSPTFSLDILIVAILGLTGMLVDSILGSLLQATYRDPTTGDLSDVCPPGGELVSGFRWMTNDLVNFLAILVTVVLAREVFWFF
ncbi:MAG: DUF92 domain-containing protein, partial [Bacteroidota bacterium]